MNKGGCETGKKVKKTKGGCAIGRKSYGPKNKTTTRKPKTLQQIAKARGRDDFLIKHFSPGMSRPRKTRSDKGVKRGPKSTVAPKSAVANPFSSAVRMKRGGGRRKQVAY